MVWQIILPAVVFSLSVGVNVHLGNYGLAAAVFCGFVFWCVALICAEIQNGLSK